MNEGGGPTFLEWLHGELDGALPEAEAIVGLVLPLARQIQDDHDAGRVAPLDGVEALHVHGGHIWYPEGRAHAPTRDPRVAEREGHWRSALHVVGRRHETAEGERDERIAADAEAVPERPEYVPGFRTWEQALGQHDALCDLHVLGLVMASFSLDLDFHRRDHLERFVKHRECLFDLHPGLHPVLADLIMRLTALERHARLQDAGQVVGILERYREQDVGFAVDFSRHRGFASRDLGDRRRLLQDTLKHRLFDLSKRNRLVYFRSTLQSLDLTASSFPLLLDWQHVQAEQLCYWHAAVAEPLLAGKTLQLGRFLRVEEAPYVKGVLDGIRLQAKRDQQEFGFSRLRLVVAFLDWHDLKEDPDTPIRSPLLLLPVTVTRKKGVRDAHLLEAHGSEAWVPPVECRDDGPWPSLR